MNREIVFVKGLIKDMGDGVGEIITNTEKLPYSVLGDDITSKYYHKDVYLREAFGWFSLFDKEGYDIFFGPINDGDENKLKELTKKHSVDTLDMLYEVDGPHIVLVMSVDQYSKFCYLSKNGDLMTMNC